MTRNLHSQGEAEKKKKQDERRVLRSFSHEQSMKERGENEKKKKRLQKGK